jgi:hypothetical protein
MAGRDVQYELKTVKSIRGMEARVAAKWQNDGWELVEQADAPMLRTSFTFRRAKKQVPRWAWMAGAAVAVVCVAAIITGSVLEGSGTPAPSAPATDIAATPSAAATEVPTEAPAESTPAVTTVPDAEVVSAFRSYFDERASSDVMVGKAVTDVSFSNRVVRVTFDPDAAGVSQELFDELKGFDNLASFAATPIAFNDDLGNRLRPGIDAIETVTPDGTSLGSFSSADILAINELSQ